MADTRQAESQAHDLFNDAEHVSRLTLIAQIAIERGDFAEAVDCLKKAQRSAGLIEARLRWTLRAVEEAAGEVTNG